ncbi:hypothetical protein BDV93DRAFT_563314 [Ceratobasidium sp. AG-I]|nr:hypothetical protein BDV93DRAFT_563314 [Ceratobasidium sp. AG-I]
MLRKNISKTSVVASMITVDYQAHITHAHDVSASRKTANHLLSLVLDEIEYVEGQLGASIVAWCSDASGESRAMRSKLYALKPHLITPDCYAHQINLVVGDFFKHVPGMAEIADKANQIVKWFRNHSYTLGLLCTCQQEEYGVTLALITAVLTRWTAHYCASARLLDIVKALIICVTRHEAELLDSAGSNDPNARGVAREVFSIIRDMGFWTQLTEMKTALRPLAIAANITQAADTRLNQVAIAMGSLYHAFTQPGVPERTSTAVCQSLEKRWAKSDQDTFIATVYFNPFYRHHLFNQAEPALHPLGLYTMLKRLFARLFPGESLVVGAFMQANTSYAAGKGHFSDENMCVQELEEQNESNGVLVTLLRIWEHFAAGEKSGEQQFARLALRCVSVVATSAGCERLFSQMGITHTKLRNRLTLSSARKIVQLKMDVRAWQVRKGLVRARPKRRRNPAESLQAEGDDSRSESDEEPEEEADVQQVIRGLTEDVAADKDVADECQGDNVGGDKDIDEGIEQDNQDSSECAERQALPRIVFRWTRELTLAQLFDYAALSGDHQAWSQVRSAWAGGITNLESEMKRYGLDDIFEQQDVVMPHRG